eukprot:3303955-Rhodomonas_salina.2
MRDQKHPNTSQTHTERNTQANKLTQRHGDTETQRHGDTETGRRVLERGDGRRGSGTGWPRRSGAS